MKIHLRKVNKKAYQLVKSEGRSKNKSVEKLGTVSIYRKERFFYVNFHRFYYFLRGGSSFHFDQSYWKGVGSFDFFAPFWNYEKEKRKNREKIG